MRRLGWLTAVVVLVVGGVAAPAAAKRAPQEKVRLREYSIKVQRGSLAAGKTKFVVKNGGGEEHEFVVVRSDDPAALPTASDGSVDEDQIPEADQVGEVEDIKAGKTKSKVFDLSPGSYVAFCNVVDQAADGTAVSHFAQGMYTTIEVR